ncbi:MAG: hypothetical protein ABIO78_06850 [Thermoanaerobaculia bacterium]
MKRIGVVLLFAIGCNNPTDPEIEIPRGRLSGLVTIGPNCPGPQQCPTPPSAYRERKVLVFNSDRSRLLFTVDIDSTGLYFIDLGAATYVVDIRGIGVDTTKDVPKAVQIRTSQVTRVDINIDTGIR